MRDLSVLQEELNQIASAAHLLLAAVTRAQAAIATVATPNEGEDSGAVDEVARAEFLRRLDDLHRSDTPGWMLSGFPAPATFGDGEQPGDRDTTVETFSG